MPCSQTAPLLVTGASRGIGAELARQLTARGARVIGAARSDFQAPGVIPLRFDFADPDAPRALADRIARDHPDCSGLIANAAIMVHADLTRGDRDVEIAREITINLTAPITPAAALLRPLAGNGPAFVNFITSRLAIAPRAEAATYCATKAGLRSFARSLRHQCGDAGLPVHVSETVMTLVATTLSRDLPGRYPPHRAAADLLSGLAAGRNEIWIQRTRLLRGPDVRSLNP